MSELMRGERNHNFGKTGKEHPKWKDNKKHPFHKVIRSLYEYRKWRTDVFKRDNFTCSDCGKNKTYVEADHHPEKFIDIIRKNKIDSIEKAVRCEELWDIENGRTLCKKCHKGKHSL
jgi:5-methylcytosine-specific restriction endonuclease McrA